MDLLGNTMTRKVETSDVNSPEFLQARAERIEKRRQRIAAKIAREKGKEIDADGSSVPSSLQFLAKLGDFGRRDDKKGQGNKSGGSESQKSPKSGYGNNNVDYSDGPLETQMAESRKQLEQIILDGETLITNVKIAAEYREKVREVRVEESKKDRLARLQEEAKESQEMYETINENWLSNAEKMLPMELYSKIQEQQKACDDLLEKQDEEIYNLRKELEDNDIDYESLLEMYQKDIMLMGDRIDDNIDTLRSAFMEELELIETYTVQDREQLLEDNQKEWMNLLKDYEELEKKSLEQRKDDALSKFERLTDLYGNVKQEARLLKNQMQNDMRTLFCEREKIKCAIQINLEKLDYNLAVLRKREEENMKMKNSMKRLLLKLQDRFNDKSKNLRDKVVKGKKESNKLIKEIRRLESLCDDAKRKTLHIYASDFHKFIDLWQLNEEECREKMCRLLGSERFIVEEQLGTGFVELDMSTLDERPQEVQCVFDKVECCCGGPPKGTLNKGKSGPLESAKSKVVSTMSFLSESPSEENKVEPPSRASLYVDPASEFEFLPGPDPGPAIQRRLMKHITNVVCDQTGFLLEEKLRKIMMPMIDSERQLIHIDTVLQALGVRHIDEMQILARYLLKYSTIMKGIISKPSLPEPDVHQINVSDLGLKKKSKSYSPQECDSLTELANEKIDQLKEQMRLTPTISEESNLNETGPKSIPSSAMDILSEAAFQNVEGIQQVRDIPPSTTQLVKKTTEPGLTSGESDGLDSTPSVLRIIEEFSSDESLAQVLKQVEKHTKKNKSAHDPSIIPQVESSSSCSCDSYIGGSADSISCGDTCSQQEDDPFRSNKATVLSWVTEVAAGLTSDCHTTGQEYRGEDELYIEEVGEDGCHIETIPVRGEGGVSGAESLVAADDELTEDEEGEQEFKKQTTPVRSSCGPSDASGMSLASRSSGLDSTEFFYIEPNDVLRALAAFCRDHNAKTKTELPTKSEVYQARMNKICFPQRESIKEYWDKFIVLLDPKSKQLWEGIQDVFLEYDENLRIRNKFVEDIVKYYRQNYELSHLLKKHINVQKCQPRIQIGPFNEAELPFCDYPDSQPLHQKHRPKFPPCPTPRQNIPTLHPQIKVDGDNINE